MTRCVSCDTYGDDDEISTNGQRREPKICRSCSLTHHAKAGHTLSRRGGKKIPRVTTSSCDPAIVTLFGSTNGCPVCKHSCLKQWSATTAGDLRDTTNSFTETQDCGLSTCDISDYLTKGGEMIPDRFLLPPAEPICCCSWCYGVRNRLIYEMETTTELLASEDGCRRMRNCVFVKRQEEQMSGQKKGISQDVSNVTEKNTTSADEKIPIDEMQLLVCAAYLLYCIFCNVIVLYYPFIIL